MSVAESSNQKSIEEALPKARRVRRKRGNRACAAYLRQVAERLPDNSEEEQMVFFTDHASRVLRGE